jgi:hypothetical protein
MNAPTNGFVDEKLAELLRFQLAQEISVRRSILERASSARFAQSVSAVGLLRWTEVVPHRPAIVN